MKLTEVADTGDFELPFSVADDVSVFMRNDPMMYRKQLFPAIMQMKDLHEKDKEVNADKCLGSAVDKAMNTYCDKFDLGKPANVFKDGDRKAIIDKIYAEEYTQIRNGAY